MLLIKISDWGPLFGRYSNYKYLILIGGPQFHAEHSLMTNIMQTTSETTESLMKYRLSLHTPLEEFTT